MKAVAFLAYVLIIVVVLRSLAPSVGDQLVEVIGNALLLINQILLWFVHGAQAASVSLS